jgi:hypothetical protein
MSHSNGITRRTTTRALRLPSAIVLRVPLASEVCQCRPHIKPATYNQCDISIRTSNHQLYKHLDPRPSFVQTLPKITNPTSHATCRVNEKPKIHRSKQNSPSIARPSSHVFVISRVIHQSGRAKSRSFAPKMWDPRKSRQNSGRPPEKTSVYHRLLFITIDPQWNTSPAPLSYNINPLLTLFSRPLGRPEL